MGDGDDEYHLRALDAVLADLSRLGFDAEWTGLRAADVGAPHGRFRFFILAWPRKRTVAVDAARVAGGWGADTRAAGRRAWFELTGSEQLLPTPVAQPSGNAPEDHLRKKPGREVVTDLAIIAENGLIGSGGRLLPTPGAYDGERGGSQHPDKRREGGHSITLQDVAEHALMPTPRASRGGSATETMYGLGAERDDEGDRQGNVTGEVSSWGPYAAAIARWEAVVGRTAPSPVRMDGKGGKARLNPELTEWMMGWPAGWVTASAQLSRAEQLKACGNGVVPQQAAAALRMLLARPGVPAVRSAVAA